MKTWRKFAVLTAFCLWISGCSWNSGQIRLLSFNNFFGSTPDTITVSKGDTVYSISRRYNLPIRDIIEANGLTPPYTLYVGRVLRLPVARSHTVVRGDTMYSISKRYNVDITTLSRLNNLREPYTLSIGQKLALPASVSSSNYVATQTPHTKITSYSTKAQTKSASKTSTYTRHTASSAKKTPTVRKAKFSWPVRGTVISNYGAIGKGRSNDGINIKAPLGTAVKAADAGRIAYAGNELKGFGNLILIQHSDGWITAYAHNNQLLVKKGQQVKRGEKIATVGSSGGVNTPQLHFEVRSGSKALNPRNYLQ